MLEDPDLSDGDRTEALLRMFYPERPPDPAAALSAFGDFADPHPAGRPAVRRSGSAGLVDWEQDFPLICAPVNRILGTECRALPYLHWHSFLAAYLEIPPESVFAHVLRIREKLRTGKKLEKYERRWYRRNMDLVSIRPRFSSTEQDILRQWV